MLSFTKKFKQQTTPTARSFFAVLGGTYGGEFLVFIQEKLDDYIFLSLPDKVIRAVPKDAYMRGVKNKVLDFICNLPKDVYKVVEQEFNSINNTNGLRNSKTNNQPYQRPTGEP